MEIDEIMKWTKEQRKLYQRQYRINHPDKVIQARIKNCEYMREKRLQYKIDKDSYECDNINPELR